jgi:hypothetical protein
MWFFLTESLFSEYSCYVSGWGIDDDVYFTQPHEVVTFREENKSIKAMKSVNRDVHKPTISKPLVREVQAWSLPKIDDLHDLIGLE